MICQKNLVSRGLLKTACAYTRYGPLAKCGLWKLLIWPSKPQFYLFGLFLWQKHPLNVLKPINFVPWICQKKSLARFKIWVVHPCVKQIEYLPWLIREGAWERGRWACRCDSLVYRTNCRPPGKKTHIRVSNFV